MINEYIGKIIRALIAANIGLQGDILFMQGALIELDNQHLEQVKFQITEQTELLQKLYDVQMYNHSLMKEVYHLRETNKDLLSKLQSTLRYKGEAL